MRCPKCDSENNDSAKFCKKCGAPLEKTISHEKMINSMNDQSGSNNTTKYIIIALIIIAIVLAGTFAYLYGFGQNQSNDSQNVQAQDDTKSVQNNNNDEPAQAESSSSAKSSSSSQSMSILGGSFSTAGGLEDKTYASIFVGADHAGEDVTIQIWYSRDGSTLNNGNMVPKTVSSSGYIEVASADPYKYFPDYAEINLYDSSGSKLLDTKSVSLSPQSGTQSF